MNIDEMTHWMKISKECSNEIKNGLIAFEEISKKVMVISQSVVEMIPHLRNLFENIQIVSSKLHR